MQFGHLNQKANQGLVFFVFQCILAIMMLLVMLQRVADFEQQTLINSDIGQYLN